MLQTPVTAALHSIWRHLQTSMHATKRPKNKLEYVTLDNGSKISLLWRREEFLRICTEKNLAEKAREIQVTIPVERIQERQYNLDPVSLFMDCFWGRQKDGVAINWALQIVHILEFKWSTDWECRRGL